MKRQRDITQLLTRKKPSKAEVSEQSKVEPKPSTSSMEEFFYLIHLLQIL